LPARGCCNQSREDYEARGVAEIRFQNKTSEAEGSEGEAAGFCRLEVASFGDEVTANRLFCKRGLQGNCMEAASSRFGLRSGQWAADAVGSVGVAD
jgi:hypothetical protein